jgi:glyoxylase-like metal-dependent hydrolase (beta-lactamase superfamily II)
MKQWKVYRLGDLEYFRFSVYTLGVKMQTVYAFRIGEVLIDTAQSRSKENLKLALGASPVQTVLLTHHHEDHSGNAAWVRHKFKADIYAHPLCVEIMKKGPAVSPLGRIISGPVRKAVVQPVLDRQTLDLGPVRLTAIYSPGHTDDHIAYHAPDRGWLFSGDLYVADRIKYFEANEEIDVQIASLEKLTALDFDVLLCSHNPKLKQGKKRLVRKLELFRHFYGDVAAMHEKGMTAADIFKSTGRKENTFYKYITVGQFTAMNMVRSVIRAEEKK